MKPSELTDQDLLALLQGAPFILEHEPTGPGKFEGNENPGLAQRLHDASLDTSWLDDTTGTVDTIGWYGLMGRFILCEDSQGFVSYIEYPDIESARNSFDAIDAEYDPDPDVE